MEEGKEEEEKRREAAMFPALPRSMHALFFLSPTAIAYISNLLPPLDNVLTWDHTLAHDHRVPFKILTTGLERYLGW